MKKLTLFLLLFSSFVLSLQTVVYINVVNRQKDKAIAVIQNNGVGFSDKAEASIVNSNDVTAPFSFDKQEEYKPAKKKLKYPVTR